MSEFVPVLKNQRARVSFCPNHFSPSTGRISSEKKQRAEITDAKMLNLLLLTVSVAITIDLVTYKYIQLNCEFADEQMR